MASSPVPQQILAGYFLDVCGLHNETVCIRILVWNSKCFHVMESSALDPQNAANHVRYVFVKLSNHIGLGLHCKMTGPQRTKNPCVDLEIIPAL